jgi:hypothetical protein
MRLKTLPARVLAAISLTSLPASAAEWSVQPSVTFTSGYDDNVNLTGAAHDPVWLYFLSPAVQFGIEQAHQGLTGNARMDILRYTGGTGRESSAALDREDYRFNTGYFHNTLLDNFRFDVNYVEDSSFDSQLNQTGEVVSRATSRNLSLGPSWTHALDQQTSTQLSYQYSDISYTDTTGLNDLVGYNYNTLSAALLYQYTPRILGTLSASYSNYQPDTDFGSRTISLQAGITANFSATLLGTLLVGQGRTTSDSLLTNGFCIGANPGSSFPVCTGGTPIPTSTFKGEIETTAPVYRINVQKTLETGTVDVALSRSSAPSSDGELLDTTRLALLYSHDFTETLRTSLNLEYTSNETIVNRVGSTVRTQSERTFLRLTPKIIWELQREWSLAGEYVYERTTDANTVQATGNAVYINLIYSPQKSFISR